MHRGKPTLETWFMAILIFVLSYVHNLSLCLVLKTGSSFFFFYLPVFFWTFLHGYWSRNQKVRKSLTERGNLFSSWFEKTSFTAPLSWTYFTIVLSIRGQCYFLPYISRQIITSRSNCLLAADRSANQVVRKSFFFLPCPLPPSFLTLNFSFSRADPQTADRSEGPIRLAIKKAISRNRLAKLRELAKRVSRAGRMEPFIMQVYTTNKTVRRTAYAHLTG